MRCKTCRYSLRRLPETRCPECGRAFNPNDPATFRPARFGGPQLRWALILVSAVFITRLIVGAIVWRDDYLVISVFNACWNTLVIAPALWLIYVFVMAIRESRQQDD